MILDMDTISEILRTGHAFEAPFTMYQFKHSYSYSLADISERQIANTLLSNGFIRMQFNRNARRVWHYTRQEWVSEDRQRKSMSILGAAQKLSFGNRPFTLQRIKECLPAERVLSDKVIGATLLGNGYCKRQLSSEGIRTWHYVRR